MPGSILALDLGRRTGVVFASEQSVLAWPRTPLEARHSPPIMLSDIWLGSGEPGQCFARFERALTETVDRKRPDYIVTEAPLVHRASRSMDATRFLMGLQAIVELIGARWEIPVREIAAGKARKCFTGSGKMGRGHKQRVVYEAQRRGYKVTDENIADAIAVLDGAINVMWPNRRAA